MQAQEASASAPASASAQASTSAPALAGAQEPKHIIVGKTYRLIKKIGEGSFGKIFLARHKETNQEVAIKLVK